MTLEKIIQILREEGCTEEEIKEYLEDSEKPTKTHISDVDMVKETGAYAYESERHQGEYTVEDYRALPEDLRVELIDGSFFVMDAPSFVHQDIATEILYQLKSQIRNNQGRCKVLVAPVDVCLDEDDKTMLQPDIVIICDSNKIKKWGIMGAPEFVLEIISKPTKKKDYYKKMMKYMNAQVQEYWIVDPDRRRLTVYDFKHEEGPAVYPLAGKRGLSIYQGEISLDLDLISEAILEYPKE